MWRKQRSPAQSLSCACDGCHYVVHASLQIHLRWPMLIWRRHDVCECVCLCDMCSFFCYWICQCGAVMRRIYKHVGIPRGDQLHTGTEPITREGLLKYIWWRTDICAQITSENVIFLPINIRGRAYSVILVRKSVFEWCERMTINGMDKCFCVGLERRLFWGCVDRGNVVLFD